MHVGEGKEMRPRERPGQSIKSIFCSAKILHFYSMGTVCSHKLPWGVWRRDCPEERKVWAQWEGEHLGSLAKAAPLSPLLLGHLPILCAGHLSPHLTVIQGV